MPVEILEIVVRAHVQEQDAAAVVANNANHGTSVNSNTKEKIIQECVEQVLAILQHNKER